PAQTTSTLVRSVRNAVVQENDEQNHRVEIEESKPWLVQVQRVEQVIQQCGPSFENMWLGSWAVLRSDNPDRCRQSAHSGRELLNQLLQHYAPNDAFSEEELMQAPQNHPTRKMRIKKILSNRAGATEFVDATARALDELYARLSSISHDHSIEPSAS